MNDQMPKLTVGGRGSASGGTVPGERVYGCVCLCVYVCGSGGGVRSVL